MLISWYGLLDEESRLRHFQDGKLAEVDEEWYKLVPHEAQEVLGREEVQRQSVIFEVIKSERDYVRDLQSMKQVFIQNLRDIQPISPRKLDAFVSEVFWNLDEVLHYHEQMLAALFARQREQHPLIQGVADIVLEGTSLPAHSSCVLISQSQPVLNSAPPTRNTSSTTLSLKPGTAPNCARTQPTSRSFLNAQIIRVFDGVISLLFSPDR